MPETAEWWRSAVIYQIYPRSFADADGDGVGDLPGILSRFDHLEELGVDAVWISPFYPSPQKDAGYDISDYRDVDPVFGTLTDFDNILERAHSAGIRVIVDLVPNHTSDQHPWFQAALAETTSGPARARYLFRPGSGPDRQSPPNNWQSVFHGPAWTQVSDESGPTGEWYFHMFDTSQPDLDWDTLEVRAEFEAILRFWLDRGVDGFRVDVASGLVKAPGLPDYPEQWQHESGNAPDGSRSPLRDQDAVHEIYRDWRRVLNEYDGERVLVAEAYVEPIDRLTRYVRSDEMHQAFNFSYLKAFDAQEIAGVIEESLRSYAEVRAPSTWVLNNHDNIRHTSRYGVGSYIPNGIGIGPNDPQPDEDYGLRHARATTAVMLALPGSAYLYQGEEFGLPEHTSLEGHHRQDPTWSRSGGTIPGRDGARVPLPWTAADPAFGFSSTGASWLPQPESWKEYAREAQLDDPSSTYRFYRDALRLRRGYGLGSATFEWLPAHHDPANGVLAFQVGEVQVLANLGRGDMVIPPAAIVISSVPFDGGLLPPSTTVWLSGHR